MHALDGAYERVNRAGIHLSNLSRRVNILQTQIRDNTITKGDPKAFFSEDGKRVIYYLGTTSWRLDSIPLTIPILVGEITYNLRAALDYLIYELARLDSKEIKENTQFPIEYEKSRFTRMRKIYLNGVNDKHVEIIERLQPYNKCEWTRTLKELSNPDKHRQLTICNSVIGISFPIKGSRSNADEQTNSHSTNIKTHLATGIKFKSVKTIVNVDILKQLKLQVTLILNIFKPEFN